MHTLTCTLTKAVVTAVGLLGLCSGPAWGQSATTEIHSKVVLVPPSAPHIALTLDACSGQFDEGLVRLLIDHKIPATLFVTQRWLKRNPAGVALIKAHLDLFDVQDHGENHIPAVIGADRTVYGLAAHPDVAHLQREVAQGARAVQAFIGTTPQWYRGATAIYDAQSVAEIQRMGYKIAGFSVNADAGATLKKDAIVARLKRVKAGDVIIAHMNKPASESAQGLAVGLQALREQGFVFVRLDQVALYSPAPSTAPAHTPATATAVPRR
jgi:peptidoglycan/xylan/chitin deacetylase (PgdA/CDA1 family)